MNREKWFTPADLDELGEFYAEADRVITMREVFEGDRHHRAIGVRHDVDDNPHALETAVEMARWEAANGWRTTYFLLHTAPYWKDGRVFDAADAIAELGHEIGLHVDALADSLLYGGDPHDKVHKALAELRAHGHDVVGVVGHGNSRVCRAANFANDEQFTDCRRIKMGDADRVLEFRGRKIRIQPRPLAEFGIQYDSVWLRIYENRAGIARTRPHQLYNTDSGGRWHYPFEETVEAFRDLHVDGQLHLLVHPDWWPKAFEAVMA